MDYHSGSSPIPQLAAPRARSQYVIRRDVGLWRLTFAGKDAVLKHERGVDYVVYLLYHPPAEPIHATALAAKASPANAPAGAVTLPVAEVADGLLLEKAARIQERSLGLDRADSLRELRRKERELQAIVEDEDATEPEKAEAHRDLDIITEYQRKHVCEATDHSQKMVRAVRMAIVRFLRHLENATDNDGKKHAVLRPFAEHLDRYLLLPSSAYCRNTAGRGGYPGCFTYKPPPDVVWE